MAAKGLSGKLLRSEGTLVVGRGTEGKKVIGAYEQEGLTGVGRFSRKPVPEGSLGTGRVDRFTRRGGKHETWKTGRDQIQDEILRTE